MFTFLRFDRILVISGRVWQPFIRLGLWPSGRQVRSNSPSSQVAKAGNFPHIHFTVGRLLTHRLIIYPLLYTDHCSARSCLSSGTPHLSSRPAALLYPDNYFLSPCRTGAIRSMIGTRASLLPLLLVISVLVTFSKATIRTDQEDSLQEIHSTLS